MPEKIISKGMHLNMLLDEGKNVCITHQLFCGMDMTPSLKQKIQEQGYKLIIDEEIPVVEVVDSTPYDTKMLIDQGMLSDDDNQVKWQVKDYTGRHSDIKRQANRHDLTLYQDNVLIWQLPVKILEAFNDITVLTFLFEGSRLQAYLSLHNIDYTLFQIENKSIVPGKQDLSVWKEQTMQHLHIYEGNLNDIVKSRTALSKNWYRDNGGKNGLVETVYKNAYNVLQNIYHAHADDCMWTIFKPVYERKSVKSFKSAYTACNLRATNEFRDRHYLAYLINRFEQPCILQWFHEQGYDLDQDALALSELIQWIWRSAIRNVPMEDVNLYVPSKRMREL